ncbi:Nucleotide-binding universal stress protein, UspA family [Halobiforma haloterrestris]|uniref:Nucleotide-binding universal stress protein, UspA family n=1 Tax=Natronobacterium haloterrestre TaxID=148448 RepID=A0A1I1JVF8_NATHA|nr:universal stress protein [Halobiforma haloterrestris]SFC52355.1 Nucleotide-binding universal stress protein, UspA family [Halobiforma haloterrestris]
MRFLVAVDGSEESENALAYAADVADAMDGSITVVHAADPTVRDEGGDEPNVSLWDADRRLTLESVADVEQRGLDLLEDAADFAAELDQDVDVELLYGDPVTEISDYADEKGFDAIFVGHRGRSERTDAMVGSVAKSIVERATIPVTVVR